MYESVSVIGLGYIGLPTAAMFASKSIRVIGVDIDSSAVDTINRGEIHIVEPGLDIAVHTAVTDGYLRASTQPEPADAFLIAVPTPFRGGNHEPNLNYIKAAALAIAPVLRPGNLVVLESTSPVGTTEQLATWLAEERSDLKFPKHGGDSPEIHIAYCPERVLPGNVMRELIHNDRLIGGMTPHCCEKAVGLYRTFVKGECVRTSARTAEMAKLTENSFRDVNIAFANELSLICDELDIDVWELIRLSNRHPRVNILQPGPGVGGHCIAVDPWFIVSKTPTEARLIRTAREVNDAKPDWVLRKVREAIRDCRSIATTSSGAVVTIACYGLSFKPDIDDLRESPALSITKEILQMPSCQVLVVEPHIDELPMELDGARLVDEASARAEADIHVMLVNHTAFGGNAPDGAKSIDTRGMWAKG
jgi:UDP-N-acetyl-D-mannosaminuronic acid dehydrogenase